MSKTPHVVCPNSTIQFHCITQGQLLLWEVQPENAEIRSKIFLDISPTMLYYLSWPEFFAELEFLSYNTTHMSSMARVRAIPAFQDAEFLCSGRRDASARVKIASKY